MKLPTMKVEIPAVTGPSSLHPVTASQTLGDHGEEMTSDNIQRNFIKGILVFCTFVAFWTLGYAIFLAFCKMHLRKKAQSTMRSSVSFRKYSEYDSNEKDIFLPE